MRRVITVLFLTFAIAGADPAPQALQPQPADTVIHITVNLVQVDAVVMDSKDKPVTDLRKEDFVILQDGKPQAITNFSFINTKEGVVRTAPVKPAAVAKGVKLPPPRRQSPRGRNRFAGPSPWWWTISASRSRASCAYASRSSGTWTARCSRATWSASSAPAPAWARCNSSPATSSCSTRPSTT